MSYEYWTAACLDAISKPVQGATSAWAAVVVSCKRPCFTQLLVQMLTRE
jgi:hypothetical protein